MLMNNIFWLIVIIVSSGIEWIILDIVASETLEPKYNKSVRTKAILGLTTITTLMTIFSIDVNIKLTISMILGFIIYTNIYKTSLGKMVLIFLLYWLTVIMLDIISSSFATLFNPGMNMSRTLEQNILRFEVTIMSKSLLFMVIPILKNFKFRNELRKTEYIYVCIPIFTNMIGTMIIFGMIFETKNLDSKNNIAIFIIAAIGLVSNLSIMTMLSRIIKDSVLRYENKVIKDKMEQQYRYYLGIQDAQLKVRKIYHDLNNHMTCIEKVYGKDESAKEYINGINKELNEWNSIFRTGNIILDIILNEKKEICDKNNIELIADINFSKCDFIEMIDTCSIFANMLDNSIEACKKIESKGIDRKVKLRGSIVNNFYIIRCENSKVNKINKQNNKIKTDKSDSFYHGIGLNSIRESVEKYEGNLRVDVTEGSFLINIYIPLRESPVTYPECPLESKILSC